MLSFMDPKQNKKALTNTKIFQSVNLKYIPPDMTVYVCYYAMGHITLYR